VKPPPERVGCLPGVDPGALRWEPLAFGRGASEPEVLAPVLGAPEVEAVAAAVRRNAEARLKAMPVARIVDAIDRTVARLLDRECPVRARLEDRLPRITGYDKHMVRLGLTGYLKTFRKPELLRFLAEDFPNPGVLDDFQPLPKGGFGRAFGPGVLAHIWAGNVPGLPLWSLVSGLLVKSGNVGKVASAEPVFAGAFVRLLEEVEPELAGCCGVVWWRGGETEPEAALLRSADLALGYGSTETLAAIQARMPPGKRFIAYGHKVSFGLVSADALDADKAGATARRAAHDVARYDQQGCFAPHMFFVERGGAISPEVFARYLARQLAAFEEKFPRRRLTLAESAAVSAWRGAEEATPGGLVIGAADGAWSVSLQLEDRSFRPSGLNRAVRVVAVDRLDEAVEAAAPYGALLQTVGVAAPREAVFDLAARLGAVGVNRIAALGDMTAPEAGWHHDGRFNLLDLVEITEIDARAEAAADELAPYVD